jgi:hypothetical protein
VPAELERISAASLAATLDLAGVATPSDAAAKAAVAPTSAEGQEAAQAATDAAAKALTVPPSRLGDRHKIIVELQVGVEGVEGEEVGKGGRGLRRQFGT